MIVHVLTSEYMNYDDCSFSVDGVFSSEGAAMQHMIDNPPSGGRKDYPRQWVEGSSQDKGVRLFYAAGRTGKRLNRDLPDLYLRTFIVK